MCRLEREEEEEARDGAKDRERQKDGRTESTQVKS